MLNINDLLREKEDDRKRVGKSIWGNIDKTGFFYHVVTKSWNGDKIFTKEIADILLQNEWGKKIAEFHTVSLHL